MRLKKGGGGFEMKLVRLKELLFGELKRKAVLVYCTTKASTFKVKAALHSHAVDCYNGSMSSVER